MSVQTLLDRFQAVAGDPGAQLRAYLAEGKQVVLTAPVYTPEEIIHAMGLIPMGAWGADTQMEGAKEYFPAFICSVMQSILELGMRGTYNGASAIVIPSLCDSLKCLGQNWKYAVPHIPFIPMTYPQNRRGEAGRAFTLAGYERVIRDLEAATGAQFSQAALARSIQVYNGHNAAMRQLDRALAAHPEISAAQRSAIFKSAWFMPKERHTGLVRELLYELDAAGSGGGRTPVMTSGILWDSPALLAILDELGFQVVADDVAAESRQYRTDTDPSLPPLEGLCDKFARMDHCSVLYDVDKKRAELVIETAKERSAKGVILALTKFCDPEEFDYPILKKACDRAGLPLTLIEVDRQMVNYEQARTSLEAFKEVIE